jgi:hypothetical protein
MHLAYVPNDPTYAIVAYLVYLAVSILVTVGAAQTLYVHGRPFVTAAHYGDSARAEAVRHLLRVGFLLTGIGAAAFILPWGARPYDAASAIESFSGRLGFVMIVLAALYFVHLAVFSAWRRRAQVTSAPSP